MAGIITKDVIIDATTTARLYLRADSLTNTAKVPILVYFHGGAFKVGSFAEPKYDHHLRSLVSEAGPLLAVSVDYRLAPSNRLPAAYDDAWTALNWVVSGAESWVAQHGDLDRLFVAGCSAGANITHQVALRAGARDDVKIKGVALVHSYFWGEKPLPRETRDPIVRQAFLEDWKLAMPESMNWNLDHPWINPVVSGAPSLERLGCERVMVCVASEDPLQWRGRAYQEELIKKKVKVELVESQGTHCFHIEFPFTPEAVKLNNKLADFFTGAK